VAHRAGHALHTAFAARILEEVDAWRLVEASTDQTHAPIPAPVAAPSAAPRLAN
jgi:UDP-3-O-acyl-N-acetylglucosamine deacetylase